MTTEVLASTPQEAQYSALNPALLTLTAFVGLDEYCACENQKPDYTPFS